MTHETTELQPTAEALQNRISQAEAELAQMHAETAQKETTIKSWRILLASLLDQEDLTAIKKQGRFLFSGRPPQ